MIPKKTTNGETTQSRISKIAQVQRSKATNGLSGLKPVNKCTTGAAGCGMNDDK